MRYLKRINENFDNPFGEEVRNDIEEILQELDLIEFEFEIRYTNYHIDNEIESPKTVKAILIKLEDEKKRFFRLEEISDVLERLRTYLNSNAKPTERYFIDLSIPNEDCYLPMDIFKREFSGEELYQLDIFIYKNI